MGSDYEIHSLWSLPETSTPPCIVEAKMLEHGNGMMYAGVLSPSMFCWLEDGFVGS